MGSPGINLSAFNDITLQKPLSGTKLQNILEMFESYIPRNRWASQILSQSPTPEGIQENPISLVPRNSEFDAQAIRVGAALSGEDGAARARSFLSRSQRSSSLDDEEVISVLQKNPSLGVRTLSTRKRQ